VTDRRDILIGAACVATAALTYGLAPRRRVSLMGRRLLDQIIPRSFANWTSRDTTDLVAPTEPDSLASRLYGVTIGRVYQQAPDAPGVMMLLAHGDSQTDDLQVHRPEICYPAFGFAISDNHATELALPGSASVPARSMVAQGGGRRETILYWTRLGEFLPQDRKQQQLDRMRTAMKGVVADGILARFSVAGPDAAYSLALARTCAAALVRAMAPGDRAALIGSSRAAQMQRSGV